MQKQSQWAFQNQRQYFKTMTKSERVQWIKKSLKEKQSDQKFEPYLDQYPIISDFMYKEYCLKYYLREQTKNPKALFIYFHGYGGHGQSSGYLTKVINQKVSSINMAALDFLNFGRSQSPDRGYIQSFQGLLDQAEAFIKMMHQKYQKPKIFIGGLSLGGAISFRLGVRNKDKLINGVVMMSPALRDNQYNSYILKKIGVSVGYMFPKLKTAPPIFTQQTKYNFEEITRKDPYVYIDKILAGTARTCLTSMSENQQMFAKFQVPFLGIQGAIDKLVDPFALIDLEKSATSNDKTIVYGKQLWHTIFGEKQMPYIAHLVSQWLKQRI